MPVTKEVMPNKRCTLLSLTPNPNASVCGGQTKRKWEIFIADVPDSDVEFRMRSSYNVPNNNSKQYITNIIRRNRDHLDRE